MLAAQQDEDDNKTLVTVSPEAKASINRGSLGMLTAEQRTSGPQQVQRWGLCVLGGGAAPETMALHLPWSGAPAHCQLSATLAFGVQD